MIRLLVLDVDGTMTDGGVYYDSTGNELKKFAIKDGAGIVLARAAGMQVMICTGRECEAVRRRAQDLHIDYLFQNVHDKAAFLSRFMAEHSLTKQDVAYCGDDLNDLTAMALCGFVACPADAAGPVLGRADFICHQKGGEGAVRGTVEEIQLRDGRLPAAVAVAGGMLGIKPLITIKEGKVAMAGKARGLPGAYVALFKKIEELGGVNPRFPSLAGYTISTREVNPIQTYLVDNLGLPEPLVRQIGCVIGTHAGPGAFGLAFFGNGLVID